VKTLNSYNRITRKSEPHNVYTVAEADEIGIAYKPWDEVHEPGDWALSEDGYVCELLRKVEYGRHVDGDASKYGLWIFPGCVVARYKKYAKTKRNPDTLILGDVLTGERRAKSLAEAANSEKGREVMRYYLLNGKNIDKAVFQAIPMATSPEVGKWRAVSKTEEWNKMINKELQDLLEAQGFSRQSVVELMDQIKTMALEKKDLTTLMRILENLFDIYGFKDKKVVKQTAELTHSQTQELLDSIMKNEHKLTVTQTKEIGTDADSKDTTEDY
jgi:hypothetical protein